MSMTSPSNSGIFRTRYGILSRPGDVSLRDVRSAAKILVDVNGADSLLLFCYRIITRKSTAINQSINNMQLHITTKITPSHSITSNTVKYIHTNYLVY